MGTESHVLPCRSIAITTQIRSTEDSSKNTGKNLGISGIQGPHQAPHAHSVKKTGHDMTQNAKQSKASR